MNKTDAPALVAVLACITLTAYGCSSAEPSFQCEEPVGSSLRLLPERAFVLASSGACSPPTSVLLINQSTEAIRVDDLGTESLGSGELIASADLPRELAPSESFRVDLRLVSGTSRSRQSVDLSVKTSEGCERFTIGAATVGEDEGGFSHPLAVDLGAFSPGAVSEPIEIVVTPLEASDYSSTVFSGGGASAPFESVDTIDPTTPRSCEPLRSTVRFRAPLERGVFEGTMFYDVEIVGQFSGTGVLHLRAQVE